MIFTERTITIIDHRSEIDSPVVLYRGDKNVELHLTIKESKFKYRDEDNINVIENAQASYGQLVIKTPNEKDPIFSEITPTRKGAITFIVTEKMIDEVVEVGLYDFQVRLLDKNKQSRATIPPIINGIEIREPIAAEDSNVLNSATVGMASAASETTLNTFDSDGNYIVNDWKFGDRITDAKLNKMDDGIYESYKLGMYNSLQIKGKASKNEIFTMANMGQDIKEAMTGGSVAVVGNNCIGLGQFIPTIQEDIGVWSNQEFTLENKAYNTTTGAEDSSMDNRILSFEINATSGDKFKIHGFTFGSTDCLIMFLNSKDAIISTTGSEMGWGTPVTYEFTCPVGTSKVRMNVWTSSGDKTIEKFVYSPIATKKDIAILDNITMNDITIFDNIKNQLESYETIDYNETTYGYAIASNKPYLYTNGGAGNSSSIITVTKGDVYRIEMTTAGTGSIKSIILTDQNDNVVSFKNLTSTISEEIYNIEIPENVTKMYVSFRKGLCIIYKKAVAKIMIDTGEGKVPDFYKEHLASKIKTIQELEMAHAGNGCTFAIITDIHWGSNKKYSPSLVKEVMENTNCKFVINNGDSAFSSRGDHNTKENGVSDLNAVRKLFNNATNNNFYCVRGNHDNNSTGSSDDNPNYLLSEGEMYSLLVEKYDHKIVGDIYNPTGLYYYFDDKKNKIRHIILDSFEEGQGEGIMSAKQMKWYCEVALNFESGGWGVCVYTHKPISPFETSQFEEVRASLRAIRYGTQYSAEYTDNTHQSYNINLDFAGKGHYVIFVATGHSHIDNLAQDNNITYFKSVCDAGYVNAVEITDRKGINSQSFDVVCVNKNTRQIDLVRIGCGNDRIFTYGENSSIIKNVNMTKK